MGSSARSRRVASGRAIADGGTGCAWPRHGTTRRGRCWPSSPAARSLPSWGIAVQPGRPRSTSSSSAAASLIPSSPAGGIGGQVAGGKPTLLDTARKIMADARRARGADIPVPTDVVSGDGVQEPMRRHRARRVDQVGADDMILDIGAATTALLTEMITRAGTVVWNGPVGVFEFDAFEQATKPLARAIAASRHSHRRRRRHAGGGGQVRHRPT